MGSIMRSANGMETSEKILLPVLLSNSINVFVCYFIQFFLLFWFVIFIVVTLILIFKLVDEMTENGRYDRLLHT